MIKVTVEIVPHGTGDPETIGTLCICNDLSHLNRPTYGNYRTFFQDNDGEKLGPEFKILNHKRSDGVWILIRRALNDE